jgi:hypothetical protein
MAELEAMVDCWAMEDLEARAVTVRMVIRLFPVAMGEMVERVALDSMAALAEPEEMAATVAGPMALPEPMRLRFLPLKMAVTQPTAPTAGGAARVVPGVTH